MYRGFISCLIRDIPLSSVYFGVLESCRKFIPKYKESTFLYPFLTGSLCGTTAWIAGLPGDCIKSQIQTNFADIAIKMKYDSTISTISTISTNQNISSSFKENWKIYIAKNGYIGLYKGILPVLSRSVITTGCCIVVVEYVNRNLFTQNE